MVAECNIIIIIIIFIIIIIILTQNVDVRDQRPVAARWAPSRARYIPADGATATAGRVGAIYRLPPPLELGYVQ